MIQDILELEPLQTQNRKLKAVWSREAQEDLRAFHNINASQQLSDLLAAEINAEIDGEILRDLRNNSTPLPSGGWSNWLPVPQPVDTVPTKPKKKQYRSIDDPWISD